MLAPVRVRCRIPEHLEKIGKTQHWLSVRTGIHESRISEIVNFKIQNPSIDRLKLIADCLKIYIDDLYEWEWRQWPE